MNFQKYNGNIHPDEWIDDIITTCNYNDKGEKDFYFVKSLVDPIISLPTEIDSIESVRDALKNDISFTIFKNVNKRKLQSLKYSPENTYNDNSRFISQFRKLCYNAEINDIEEQKKYLYKSLPMNHLDYISNEFYEKMKNVNSVNELFKEFEDFAIDESQLITNGSIVALKHIATGKYLSSIRNLNYTTGSKQQLVFVGSPEPGPNSLWKIQFLNNELAAYNDTSIKFQHDKSGMFLGISIDKSPSTERTEVRCDGNKSDWKFNRSKLENHKGCLKSNDTINLNIRKMHNTQDGQVEYLRSHDIQFTIRNDSFQEVVCHNERLGGNDEWCIELIKQFIYV